MTLLTPGYLAAAALLAGGVVAAHLISTREPRAAILPTARFVPAAPLAARVRRARFSDPRLLALRVVTILLAGLALARPVLRPRRARTVRVIMVDGVGIHASPGATRDSLRRLVRAGDVIVPFDSATHSPIPVTSTTGAVDAALRAPTAAEVSALSPALLGAYRAARGARASADSVELVIVSPFASSAADRATAAIRAAWAGRVRVVLVPPPAEPVSTGATALTWPGDTPLARAVRSARADTAGAVVAGDDVVVAPFVRAWRFPAESLSAATVIARWVDGTPAAIAWRDSLACHRSIAIALDSVGDVPLRAEWRRLRRGLVGPCVAPGGPPDPAVARLIAGSGRLASVAQLPPDPGARSTVARWLMLGAVGLALLELVARRIAPRPA